jgi:hypothetical protein
MASGTFSKFSRGIPITSETFAKVGENFFLGRESMVCQNVDFLWLAERYYLCHMAGVYDLLLLLFVLILEEEWLLVLQSSRPVRLGKSKLKTVLIG